MINYQLIINIMDLHEIADKANKEKLIKRKNNQSLLDSCNDLIRSGVQKEVAKQIYEFKKFVDDEYFLTRAKAGYYDENIFICPCSDKNLIFYENVKKYYGIYKSTSVDFRIITNYSGPYNDICQCPDPDVHETIDAIEVYLKW